ncbi:MAG: cobalamin-dependent protein [Thermodesulfobacteriota bacterium]
MKVADELDHQRSVLHAPGLWAVAPVLVTATIDDGIGQGISIIGRFAEAVGIVVKPLGLMQSVDTIVEACLHLQPNFLGLTVLQFDSEPIVAEIASRIPEKTRLICGGPVFRVDPEFAQRTGVHAAALHVGDFLDILLMWSAEQKSASAS